MTGRERLFTVLKGNIPDCVPVAPDFSNMIPAKLTGKPFWDLYLYNDPPIWEAYLACAKYFDIDSLMDGYMPFKWPCDPEPEYETEKYIVYRDEQRIVTQNCRKENGKKNWEETVDIYYVADPPTFGVSPLKINLPMIPNKFEPVEGIKPVDCGITGLQKIKKLMGEQGLVGIRFASTIIVNSVESVYYFEDHPEELEKIKEQRILDVERRFADLKAMKPEERPDFLCVGGSGTLIFQTPSFFYQHAFPAVKYAIGLADTLGIPTHVHSCGPEKELVRIFAEESKLTVIDPLEVPPMGDCNLRELKKLYGKNITLKGNLHTTEVMLRGTPETVLRASKMAIDDAAEGGRFILSTGDQCGRDTPEENLRAMIEAARTYGRY